VVLDILERTVIWQALQQAFHLTLCSGHMTLPSDVFGTIPATIPIIHAIRRNPGD
jgi:hypothetical protein